MPCPMLPEYWTTNLSINCQRSKNLDFSNTIGTATQKHSNEEDKQVSQVYKYLPERRGIISLPKTKSLSAL